MKKIKEGITLELKCSKCETTFEKKFRSLRRKKLIKCANCNKYFYMSKEAFERLRVKLDEIHKSINIKIK
jgi:protein-arginine kinase activator protein McsA